MLCKSGNKTRRTVGFIHPVVVFPFRLRPNTALDLSSLFGLLEVGQKYLDPIFVINNQTADFAKRDDLGGAFDNLSKEMERISGKENILRIWSVDTCQMWLSGLGYAFDKGTTEDVYWLIPGDFDYAEPDASKGLEQMSHLPKMVLEGYDLSIGQIDVDPDNSKQLIDTYGTYGLLYNWFPNEAVKIRNKTRKPRTEFFAIAGKPLECLLMERWFPYEQMVFILLNAVRRGWSVTQIELPGLIDDRRQRETLHGAMEQIERCERALKLHWREHYKKGEKDWDAEYRLLDDRSEEIRRAALTVLSQYLSL